MYYVYVLMNEYGIVEYIGETQYINRRYREHTKLKSGKFHGRTDLKLEVVKEFSTRKEALKYEGELKLALGFEWTEKTCGIKSGKLAVDSGQWATFRQIGLKLGLQRAAQRNKELYSQPFFVYRKDSGEFVGEYESQNEAARQLGLKQGAINNVLCCRRNSHAGYTFKRK
jgi:predicted GIY-YIG superfamily endonuclease